MLLQLAADGRAYQTAVASYVDETVFLQGIAPIKTRENYKRRTRAG
jgi:hypothetical protein